MDWWIAEAMELAQRRAPAMTDEHALDLADDLYTAWPDDTPAGAVDKFFRVVGPNLANLQQRIARAGQVTSER